MLVARFASGLVVLFFGLDAFEAAGFPEVFLVAFVALAVAEGFLAADVVVVLRLLGPELFDAVDRDGAFRFDFESPMGSASPTALIAPDATPPTAPAILPARLPTFLTTLPGSGIGFSSTLRADGAAST